MGCHINLYEVVPCSKDINKLQETYYTNPERLNRSKPYLYYHYKDRRTGKQKQKIRFSSVWASDVVDDWNWYTMPVKHNRLTIFKPLSFNIPCDYLVYKDKVSRRIYPEFIELKEVDCPWVRGGEFDIHFTDKDIFLKYFREEFFAYSMWTENKAEKWVNYKEDYQFFADTFVNGKHLIRLG
jgi:hypothetical protein